MSNTAEAGHADFDAILIEADRTAPLFKYKINPFFLAVIVAALLSTLAPLVSPFPFDWLLLYVAPFVVMFASLVIYNRTTGICSERYKEQITEVLERRYANRGVDMNRLASRLWLRNNRGPPLLGYVYLILLVVLAGAHFWRAFGDLSLSSLTTFGAWLGFVGRVLLFLLGLVVSFVGAASVAAAVWVNKKFTLDELRRDTFGPDWEIDDVDANMLQIVQEEVSLKTTLRRVETYTMESTFLGALAFSAFVTILIESDIPVGDFAWLAEVRLAMLQVDAFGYSVPAPWTNLGTLIGGHVGPTIAAFLLSGAVSFLAVLVARIQFTDAYRHAEGLHAQASKLNEKAEKLLKEDPPRAEKFTQQAALLITQLEQAERKITPILDFMRFFRNLGLWLFLAAIAICGLYYSAAIMGVIVGLFLLSTLFFMLYRSFTLSGIVRNVNMLDWRLGSGGNP